MNPSRLLLSFMLLHCLAAISLAADADEGWSKVENGLQARLSFSKTEGINGTPYIVTYLELRNVSDVGNVMEVPLKIESIQFELTDENGKTVSPSNGSFDGMSVELERIRGSGPLIYL